MRRNARSSPWLLTEPTVGTESLLSCASNSRKQHAVPTGSEDGEAEASARPRFGRGQRLS